MESGLESVVSRVLITSATVLLLPLWDQAIPVLNGGDNLKGRNYLNEGANSNVCST